MFLYSILAHQRAHQLILKIYGKKVHPAYIIVIVSVFISKKYDSPPF